jgi:hypothetical protein
MASSMWGREIRVSTLAASLLAPEGGDCGGQNPKEPPRPLFFVGEAPWRPVDELVQVRLIARPQAMFSDPPPAVWTEHRDAFPVNAAE